MIVIWVAFCSDLKIFLHPLLFRLMLNLMLAHFNLQKVRIKIGMLNSLAKV